MTRYNTWTAGQNYYLFGSCAAVPDIADLDGGGSIAVTSFQIADTSSGAGITFDMIFPPFSLTKPPKVMYSTSSPCILKLKDSAGWFWSADMPAQPTAAERGYGWEDFTLAGTQDNTGTLPSNPASGPIQIFQFQSTASDTALQVAYVAGLSPLRATAGDVRSFSISYEGTGSADIRVGDVRLVGAIRTPILYYPGALPFGYAVNDPGRGSYAGGASSATFQGPFTTGYQNFSPWLFIDQEGTPPYDEDDTTTTSQKVANTIALVAAAQATYTATVPGNIQGPSAPVFLPVMWESEQYGAVNTWTWDGPDGNGSWGGWQYRLMEYMAQGWYNLVQSGDTTNATACASVVNKFLAWLDGWLTDNPSMLMVPVDFPKNGAPALYYSTGTSTSPAPEPHMVALCLKATIWSALAGADATRAHRIIGRLFPMLQSMQVTSGPMQGCFCPNPTNPDGSATYSAYGFQQGEIMDALSLGLQHPEWLVVQDADVQITNPDTTIQVAPGTSLTALSTSGNQIVDLGGNPVRMTGVTWSGFESSALAPKTLDSQPYKTVTVNGVIHEGQVDRIKRAGFNCVRIPVCADMTLSGVLPSLAIDATLNPDLYSGNTVRSSLEVLDAIVTYCGSQGIRVILDMKSLVPGGTGNGLWYTTQTPTSASGGGLRNEADWVDAWTALATRYRGSSAVVGADLIDRPYACTWDDSPTTGLPAAVERCMNAVHLANPNWLAFVQGVQGTIAFDDSTSHETVVSGDLTGVAGRPVTLHVPDKVVYSPHEYTTYPTPQPWTTAQGFPANMIPYWRKAWGYVYEQQIAPVLIGEFGSPFTAGADGGQYTSANAAIDAQWANALMLYLNGDLDSSGTVDIAVTWKGMGWCYYSLEPGPLGILGADAETIDQVKIARIQQGLETSSSANLQVNAPLFLSRISSSAVTVSWTLSNGSAIAGTDYLAASGTLTFPAGSTSASIPITVFPSTAVGSKTIVVNLSNPIGATLSDADMVVTLAYSGSDTLTPNLVISIPYAPKKLGEMLSITMRRRMLTPQNFGGSYAKCLNAPSRFPQTISLRINNTEVATITWAVGDSVGTFSSSSSQLLIPGDSLSLNLISPPDDSFSMIGVAIRGVA